MNYKFITIFLFFIIIYSLECHNFKTNREDFFSDGKKIKKRHYGYYVNPYYSNCVDYPLQYPNYLDNALYTNQIINAYNAGYVAGSNYGFGNFRKRRSTKGVNARYERSY